MSKLTRFGRRIALPSTRQIRHELLVMMNEDEKQKALLLQAVENRPVAPPTIPPG